MARAGPAVAFNGWPEGGRLTGTLVSYVAGRHVFKTPKRHVACRMLHVVSRRVARRVAETCRMSLGFSRHFQDMSYFRSELQETITKTYVTPIPSSHVAIQYTLHHQVPTNHLTSRGTGSSCRSACGAEHLSHPFLPPTALFPFSYRIIIAVFHCVSSSSSSPSFPFPSASFHPSHCMLIFVCPIHLVDCCVSSVVSSSSFLLLPSPLPTG